MQHPLCHKRPTFSLKPTCLSLIAKSIPDELLQPNYLSDLIRKTQYMQAKPVQFLEVQHGCSEAQLQQVLLRIQRTLVQRH